MNVISIWKKSFVMLFVACEDTNDGFGKKSFMMQYFFVACGDTNDI
jgi:hypothetical protein